MIGDVLHDRYRIVDKLGFGGYSTVWLAQDRQREEYVAVKVGIANSPSQEMKSLRALSALSVHPGHDAIPSPLDEFEVRGPNGVHPCYTMAPARCNLREASFSYLFPLDVARALVGGLTMAISHMHSCGYVHGDIHLRNMLVKLPSSFNHLSVEQFYEEYGEPETVPITRRDGKPLRPVVPPKAVIPLYLAWMRTTSNCTMRMYFSATLASHIARHQKLAKERTATHHLQHDLQKPDSNRRPLFHTRLISGVWQWRFGRYWEILGMNALLSNEYIKDDEMVSQHIDVLGSMPTSWWDAGRNVGNSLIKMGVQRKGGRYGASLKSRSSTVCSTINTT